jgi:predicted membrane-bound spermidine synthase
MIPLLVDRNRSAALEDDLANRSPTNTVEHPRAVLLAGALHEARALPGLLSAAAAIERRGTGILGASLSAAAALLLASSLSPRAAVGASAATVGFCSMGWWLLLISIWQSSNGSVYSEIGALTGLFMAGIAVGSLAASRLHAPEHAVASVLAAGAGLSAALALGAAMVAATLTVPALLAVGGLLTGAAFPGLTRLGPADTRRAAGVVFGFDELGAAAAALVIGILVIPWAGLTATASGLAVIQAAAIPAVLGQLRRRRTGA